MTEKDKQKMHWAMHELRKKGASSSVIADSVYSYEQTDKTIKILKKHPNITLREYLEITGIEDE